MTQGQPPSLGRDALRNLPLRFRGAAVQRLEAAEYLGLATQQGYGFGLDAIYLGGYAVECAIKALLFAKTPLERRLKLYREISCGKGGHNLETLKRKLAALGCLFPADVGLCFPTIRQWDSELRYQTRRIMSSEATSFLAAARRIAEWAGRSW